LVSGAATITEPVAGLSAGTTYFYRVRAVNGNGTSASSANVTAITLPAAPVATAATSATTTAFTANWGSVTGATKYRLDVSTDNTFTTGLLGGYTNLDVGNVTTVTVTGLTAGTAYFYQVRAENANGGGTGTSASSNAITLTTLSAITATAASTITATGFTANWNAVGSATTYKLDVSTVSNFASFVTGFNNQDVTNVTTFAVTGLASGTTYYYRVRAVVGGTPTASSNTISLITTPAPPAATTATTFTTTALTATWGSGTAAATPRVAVSTN